MWIRRKAIPQVLYRTRFYVSFVRQSVSPISFFGEGGRDGENEVVFLLCKKEDSCSDRNNNFGVASVRMIAIVIQRVGKETVVFFFFFWKKESPYTFPKKT